MTDPLTWPIILNPLIAVYQHEAIWNLSLFLLGYPVTMVTTGREVQTIRKGLDTLNKRKG